MDESPRYKEKKRTPSSELKLQAALDALSSKRAKTIGDKKDETESRSK